MSLQQTSNAESRENAVAEKDNDERKPRFSHRKKAASVGVLHSPQINGAVHCVVRDMSVSGARILVKESKLIPTTNGKMGLPETFTLHLRIDRVAVECKVIRQDGDEFGVRFTSAPRVLSRSLR